MESLKMESLKMENLSQDESAMLDTTPSPSASTTPSTNSASRRPPRKSTVTQQQKNMKRQRATQDQLAILEIEFSKNPTPTASVRERIADQIDMTERSVQIWFQNRRAKIKLLAKKGVENGDDIDNIPETMRQYLYMQMESSQPMGLNYMCRSGYDGSNMMMGEQGTQGKVVIVHFTCTDLKIGTFRRAAATQVDLIVFYSPEKACITYYIHCNSRGFKIEYPFAYIKNIYLKNGDPKIDAGLVIELNRPPNFFTDAPNSGGWFSCDDFTEDQQASQVMVHELGGDPRILSGQLAKLVSLDSFVNRHMLYDYPQLTVSAPVSPVGHRPSSQPGYNPQAHVGMFQETQWGIGVHPGARGPGHKRQRSRSVPAAIDFSMFSTPMPSFVIQHPGEQERMHTHNPNIFAPIPQQPNMAGIVNPNMRVDTAPPSFAMDYRQYPVSTAATTPPAEYASPFPYSTSVDSTPIPNASTYSTPYSVPFLSPMDPSNSQHMMQPPISPLSFISHSHDPAIVDQSPPLNMMHRSVSADPYTYGQHDPHNPHHLALGNDTISDDGLGLNELYSKHTLSLPMHIAGSPSPSHGYGHGSDHRQQQIDLDMNQLVHFDQTIGNIDQHYHSSLSPEAILNQ